MSTELWIDPHTRRVVHFSPVTEPAPTRVTQITNRGVVTHELDGLPKERFEGPLPPAMLPQVCWLYRLEHGRLDLAAALD